MLTSSISTTDRAGAACRDTRVARERVAHVRDAAGRRAGRSASPWRARGAARCTTGRCRSCRARSAAWLKPRWRGATGAAAPAPRRRRRRAGRRRASASARPAAARASGVRGTSARERWRAARRRTRRRARDRSTAGGRGGSAGSRPAAAEARHAGSGSPQRSQSGGVSGRIDGQQALADRPRVGRTSGWSQAAQAGARRTAEDGVGMPIGGGNRIRGAAVDRQRRMTPRCAPRCPRAARDRRRRASPARRCAR